MAVITFKCSDKEKEAFQEFCNKEGVTPSAKLRALMNNASGSTPETISLIGLHERVKVLESKFSTYKKTPNPPKRTLPSEGTPPNLEAVDKKDLITVKEIAELTGYSVGTIGGKLSLLGIKSVSRVGGNRAGLYSKSEIIEKMGYKP